MQVRALKFNAVRFRGWVVAAGAAAAVALPIASCAGGGAESAPSATPSGAVQAPVGDGNGVNDGGTSTAPLPATSSAKDAGVAQLFGDGGNLCGCALCAPLASNDTCTTDSECAPEVPCHAQRCVGKAHATLRKPGDMCTEVMMCNSSDANGCGCVKGKCTLFPR